MYHLTLSLPLYGTLHYYPSVLSEVDTFCSPRTCRYLRAPFVVTARTLRLSTNPWYGSTSACLAVYGLSGPYSCLHIALQRRWPSACVIIPSPLRQTPVQQRSRRPSSPEQPSFPTSLSLALAQAALLLPDRARPRVSAHARYPPYPICQLAPRALLLARIVGEVVTGGPAPLPVPVPSFVRFTKPTHPVCTSPKKPFFPSRPIRYIFYTHFFYDRVPCHRAIYIEALVRQCMSQSDPACKSFIALVYYGTQHTVT